MKTTKKILAVMLAALMLFVLSSTAFARTEIPEVKIYFDLPSAGDPIPELSGGKYVTVITAEPEKYTAKFNSWAEITPDGKELWNYEDVNYVDGKTYLFWIEIIADEQYSFPGTRFGHLTADVTINDEHVGNWHWGREEGNENYHIWFSFKYTIGSDHMENWKDYYGEIRDSILDRILWWLEDFFASISNFFGGLFGN